MSTKLPVQTENLVKEGTEEIILTIELDLLEDKNFSRYIKFYGP